MEDISVSSVFNMEDNVTSQIVNLCNSALFWFYDDLGVLVLLLFCRN